MFQNQVCWPNQTPSPVLPVKILVVVPSPFPTYMFDPRKVFPDPIYPRPIRPPNKFDLIIILSSIVVTRRKIIGIVTISLVPGLFPFRS